jgi:hypothetical protein
MPNDLGKGRARNSGRLLGWGLGFFGAVLLGLSAFTIISFVGAVVSRAPIIMWDEGGWIALPIALALLALALILYVGRHDGQNVAGRGSNAIKRLLVLSACLLPLVIVFPLSAYWLAGSYLESQGYEQCGARLWIATGRASALGCPA